MEHIYFVTSSDDTTRQDSYFFSMRINDLNDFLTQHPTASVKSIIPAFKGEGRPCTEAYVVIKFDEGDSCDPVKMTRPSYKSIFKT